MSLVKGRREMVLTMIFLVQCCRPFRPI